MGTNVPPRTEITTEERLAEVMADVEKRVANDDLVFVRIRGELDYLANSKKEDMIVVTGMTSTIAKPSDQIGAQTTSCTNYVLTLCRSAYVFSGSVSL